MSQNVGEIDLGLSVNQQQFNRQLNGIAGGAQNSVKSAFGGMGKLIGATLGAAAVIGFGKQCLELGSNLSEVQNVVDVTFGSMASDVNNFAKEAITSLGLSETSAKKYTSTMGAMLKSMQIPTKQALDMSKNITGLSADMASFYNLDTEDAFAKIRSGISGETEPLKQLGINMSVANMEAYALSQGMTKAYAKMSQQEQTLLRYNYLLSVTGDAQGDFARTSDSWANQTRILSEQFNSLKASLGQGFINILTPVVKWLNTIVVRLQQVAAHFKAFTEMLFGVKQESTNAISESVGGIADNATSASDNIEGIGDSAKDAAKKAKGALSSFDELNQISLNNGTSDSKSTSSTQPDNLGTVADIDLGSLENSTDVVNDKFTEMFDNIKKSYEKLKKLFSTGFNIGKGFDFKDKLENLKNSMKNILSSFKDIFTNNDVSDSAKKMIDKIVMADGLAVGSFISIGTTIATNIVGGISKYLDGSKEFIKERLASIFTSTGDIFLGIGKFDKLIAEMFSPLSGETGQQVTANIIGIFANGFLGALDLALKFGADLINCILEPLENNKTKIVEAIENTLKSLETSTGTIKDIITNTFSKISESYDTYVKLAFDNISSGFDKILGAFLDGYNNSIAPIIDKWATKWDEFSKDTFQPVVNDVIEVLGKLILTVSKLWDEEFAPAIAWLETTFAPIFATVFDNAGQNLTDMWTAATESIEGITESLEGIITFLDGQFSGDWEKMWEGCKKIFKGVFDTLYDIVKTPLNNIIDDINKVISGLNEMTSFKFDGFNIMGKNVGSFEVGGLGLREIPKLATGGIVAQPTLAMVGEAGREAVMPLENHTGWMDTLANKLVDSMMAYGGVSSGSSSNQPIQLVLDGKIIYETVLKQDNQNFKRTGNSAFVH